MKRAKEHYDFIRKQYHKEIDMPARALETRSSNFNSWSMGLNYYIRRSYN